MTWSGGKISRHSAAALQVRNKNRFDELKALGATEVIDVTTEDVPARVQEITGALKSKALTVVMGYPSAAHQA